jgi:hypothetical protein
MNYNQKDAVIETNRFIRIIRYSCVFLTKDEFFFKKTTNGKYFFWLKPVGLSFVRQKGEML